MKIGDVCWMDPNVLIAHARTQVMEGGAETTTGPHRFLCVAVDGDMSVWAMLMSRDASYRVRIPRALKSSNGDPRSLRWLYGPSFANPSNLWIVSARAVEAARANLGRLDYGACVTAIPTELLWLS